MKYDFGTVSERDMDMLFMNAFCSERSFLQLFINKTNLPKADYSIEELYLSKTDKDGESDITIVISSADKRYGLLIEDKIDALAMPEQQKRYTIRGDKAVKKHEYDEYRDFIVCSKGYYEINEEAKKYSYFVSYEECADCLEKSNAPLAEAWVQQINQAIIKSKRHSETELDKTSNAFYNAYKDYQENNYPMLDLRTSRNTNGWWTQYATRYKKVYILHKIKEGYVDLTFPNAASKMDGLSNIANTLNRMVAQELTGRGLNAVCAIPTGKAGSLRIEVPKFAMSEMKFDDADIDDLDMCFFAISVLSDFANMLASVADITKE